MLGIGGFKDAGAWYSAIHVLAMMQRGHMAVDLPLVNCVPLICIGAGGKWINYCWFMELGIFASGRPGCLRAKIGVTNWPSSSLRFWWRHFGRFQISTGGR